jgi:hypothetical protein
MNCKILLAVIVALLSLTAMPAHVSAAGTLYGSVSVTGYVYGDTLEERQADLYSGVLLNLRDDSGLFLNLSGRLRQPLTEDVSEDWNLYSTYVGWTSPGRHLSVSAGRRLMFMGVIRGFHDGVMIKLDRIHAPSALSFTVIGGTQVSGDVDPKLLNTRSSRHLGVAAALRLFGNLDAQLSSSIALEDTETYSDQVGLLCGWQPDGPLRFDGSCEYDIDRERGERIYALAAYSASTVSISAEYLVRESVWIPESSWYSRFADLLDPCSQYRLALTYDPAALDWLSGGVYWVATDQEEHSISGYLSAWGRLTAGYRFSGDSDIGRGGIYGSYGQKLSEQFRADVGVDFSRYTVYDLYDLPTYGSHARLSFDPGGALHFFSELQYSRNRIMDSDVRAYIGGAYRFRRIHGGPGSHVGGPK